MPGCLRPWRLVEANASGPHRRAAWLADWFHDPDVDHHRRWKRSPSAPSIPLAPPSTTPAALRQSLAAAVASGPAPVGPASDTGFHSTLEPAAFSTLCGAESWALGGLRRFVSDKASTTRHISRCGDCTPATGPTITIRPACRLDQRHLRAGFFARWRRSRAWRSHRHHDWLNHP